MQITITARHFELAESHRNHAAEVIEKLDRFSDHIISANMILTLEKYRHTAELKMQVEGALLTSKEEATELSIAVDNAAGKMERQLKKHNEKLHNHRVKRSKREYLKEQDSDPMDQDSSPTN